MSEQLTLNDGALKQPLPARLRPETIDEIVGQKHLLGEGRILRRIIEHDAVSSMIFWGRPASARPPSRTSSRTRPRRALSIFQPLQAA